MYIFMIYIYIYIYIYVYSVFVCPVPCPHVAYGRAPNNVWSQGIVFVGGPHAMSCQLSYPSFSLYV